MGTASSPPRMPLAQVYKITYRGPENHIKGLIRTRDIKNGYQILYQNTDLTDDDIFDLRLIPDDRTKLTNYNNNTRFREPLYTFEVILDGPDKSCCHADFGLDLDCFGMYTPMSHYGLSDSTIFQREMWTSDGRHLFTVLYGVFEEAAEASVRVSLTNVNSDCDLCGTIYARTSAITNPLYKNLLFFKDIGDPAMEPVENGLLVSRSLVAVPLESDLILEICLSGGENHEIVPNIEVFKCFKGAPSYHRKISCSNWDIEVDVLWRYEFLERTEAPEEKNPGRVYKTMSDSDIGENFRKKMYREKPIQIYKRVERDRDEYLEAPFSTHHIRANFVRYAECIHKIQEKKIDDLTATIKNAAWMNQLEEFESCTKELDDIIAMYPKLGSYLEKDLLELIVGLLKDRKRWNLQSLACTILQSVFAHSNERNMLIENIKSEIFMDLVLSNVHIQAMELLHFITFANPDPKMKAILEAVVERVVVLMYDPPTNQALHSGGKALASICRVYPELPPNKLKKVLDCLVYLLEYKSLMEVRSYACSGFRYLCDKRQQMVVEKKYFKPLYDAIVDLTMLWVKKDNSHEIAVAAFATVGSIVRCTDEFVKFMIDEDELWLITSALEKEQLYIVKNACWILSNITAGNTNYFKESNYTELIHLLVRIVESYQYIEAKEEAMWALLNAIDGVGPDNEGLKKQIKQYIKPLWRTLKACRHHEQLAYLCLEALVKLEGVEFTCNDKPLGGADFQKILVELYGGFQAEGITNYNLAFRLTCTYEEEDAQQPLLLSYNGLVDKLPCVLLDSEERADPSSRMVPKQVSKTQNKRGGVQASIPARKNPMRKGRADFKTNK